jgi:hypothetical protein
MSTNREKANQQALERILEAEPVLVDIRPAIEVVPGMTPNTILTSGAPLAWSEIEGVQRKAIINAVVYEGLAATGEEATAKLEAGEVEVKPCQAHACLGIATGIYTASSPVHVIENAKAGNRAFCHLIEGSPPRLFAFGAYGDDVVERLRFIEEVYAPVVAEAVRLAGGVPVKPLMRRALTMGDELHNRTEAATQLFISTLAPHLLQVAKKRYKDVERVMKFLQVSPFAFLRVVAPAVKCMLDAGHGVEGSSLLTGMIQSCKDFAIRVSGLGDEWFRGPQPEFKGEYFWGNSADDVGWGGGECIYTEAMGLGGFAQVAAFALPFRGTPAEMVERNQQMYEITIGEHPELKIPFFNRGIPLGVDIFRVVETGIQPVLNLAVLRKDGEGMAGVGPTLARIDAFKDAVQAFEKRYGPSAASRN